MSDLVTTTVAADILDVSRQRVHQLVAEGVLEAIEVETGGDVMARMLVFKRSVVERYCRERQRSY